MRKTHLLCTIGVNDIGNDTFSVVCEVFFPTDSECTPTQNNEECRLACLSNFSCTAYVYDDKCFIWIDDLYSGVPLSPYQIIPYLNIRMATSPLSEIKAANRRTTYLIVNAILIVLVLMRRRYFISANERVEDSVVLYKYWNLKFATKNFSKKLRKEGFGSIFKGILPDSSFVVVKKLKNLQQVEKQFRVEVKTIGEI